LDGETKQHVGRLDALLGDYEEEREAERVRNLRRERAQREAALPEDVEADSDEEELANSPPEEPPTDEEVKRDLNLIKERFIY
jgi:hypothetical protein